jgi:GDPmannose 4,6-dehydratase
MSEKKIAYITGISGQDGSYLSELLLSKGYIVYGMIRRNSSNSYPNIEHIRDKLNLIYGDVTDSCSISTALNTIFIQENKDFKVLEIYSLAAMSHVKISFDIPLYTGDCDGLGTLRILEAILKSGMKDKIRFYQASTSELFGRVLETPQKETTPFNPLSPYATAKMYAYYIVKNYRESYKMFAVNGTLFNHESVRRGEEFVTRKISKAVAALEVGKQKDNCLYLGNLNACRDIGCAREYCEGMWLMLQAETPTDYVLSSGETYPIRDMVQMAFNAVGKIVNWEGKNEEETGSVDGKVVVRVDPKFFRPNEVELLLGDSTKARKELGWKPVRTAQVILKEMVLYDLDKFKN